MANLTPPFDKAKFTENFKGMEVLANELVLSFMQNLPALLNDIESAMQNYDTNKLEISAHALKGALLNFYAEPAKNVAWQLEKCGHKKDLNEGPKLMEKLKYELRRLIQELREDGYC